MPDKDFFISYNRADHSWAEWVAWQLEEAGYLTIIQAWDFRPGSNFVLEMNRAAVEAKRVIAILSPDYLTSLFTQPEWAVAFAEDPMGAGHAVLPVRVRECSLKGLLAQIVYIDLVGLEELAARNALLQGVIDRRIKPSVPPHFPGSALHPTSEPPQFPAITVEAKQPTPAAPTGTTYNLAALRQMLTEGLTDEEVNHLCRDHFPNVYEQFSSGMPKTEKLHRLIEYCSRRRKLPALLDLFRDVNPELFAERGERLLH
jgi:hypothetical protein